MSVIKTEPHPVRPSTISVSAFKKLLRCSEEYRLHYVLGMRRFSISNSTLMGNLLHDALELLYDPSGIGEGMGLIACLSKTYQNTLRDVGVVPVNTPWDLLDRLYTGLWSLALDTTDLHWRAHPDYQGSAPIRKKDGGVTANYQSTTDWKVAERELGLADRRAELTELLSTSINPGLPNELDVVSSFSEAVSYASRFTGIPEFKKSLHVEFPIGVYQEDKGELLNPVIMPGTQDVYITGYIDWVGMVDRGGPRGQLAVVDYKSSKDAYTEEQVRYNVQLYTYIYCYEELTGKKVKWMGIYNIREGRLALVEVDRALMKRVLDNFFSTYRLVEMGLYLRHSPEDNHSPCLNSFRKPCPYLDVCYPELVKVPDVPTVDPELLQLYNLRGLDIASDVA